MDPVTYIRETCKLNYNCDVEDFIGMGRAYELACFTFTHSGPIDIRAPYGILQPLAQRVLCQEHSEVKFRSTSTLDWSTTDIFVRAILRLFESQKSLPAEHWYRTFTQLRPFDDGNKRVGSLFFNLLNGTIQSPIHPSSIHIN